MSFTDRLISVFLRSGPKTLSDGKHAPRHGCTMSCLDTKR
jgi:hypothetical protein